MDICGTVCKKTYHGQCVNKVILVVLAESHQQVSLLTGLVPQTLQGFLCISRVPPHLSRSKHFILLCNIHIKS